ncbi:hypothetical protein ONE63_011275 [Megalurothrips usitatus]|uniref:DDE Tnp4 domain-containing protein n=1 Tax=Megalurothrips usitatus TaxID=439358 RepID=A0AAV7X3B2_9NEOP|nr:hypothetical protein ONE63_011275 [Megalurothrips usitatus]
MVSMSFLYRIGKTTTSGIIAETCKAIWSVLQPEVLVPPSDQWEAIASNFYARWNFPNCVGAIDGKHVVVQCFKSTGSAFYNYKGTFSTVLMACCDGEYRFIFITIGSAGRESDGGIFQTSDFGQAILRERLPLPQAKTFQGFHVPLPAVFVEDAAFPLLRNLMRPYGGVSLSPAQTIFNYRLSRARRVVENAFGVLASRFRIFRRPIIASAATVDRIVQATVVLQYWLRCMDIANSGANRQYIPQGYAD